MNFSTTAGLMLLSVLSLHGQGILVYDQQSSDESFLGGGVADIQPSHPLGQSFTPGLSSIGFVRIYLSDSAFNGVGATVLLNLRSNSISGPILSSTEPVFVPDRFHGTVNFLFTTPVPLSSGTPYTFQVTVQSGDVFGVYSYNTFNYTAGTAIFNGVSDPAFDLWFREGIIVPEPSSALLLVTGVAFLLFVHRMQTK